ncbi:Amidohydrolase 3 [Parvibaculum lavamentivorans DS-1]|uniref:Amidohydrolase 3 n=1 Tax=Parvibaculum lavamentivorans (strain DS-1 / DSM 13023 / NCIMB 13966) TaxID=402881 RepID=A7HRW1_PARL1|nr:amidohydrolase family protein [Parvibaculum lavamentivorans]ABS62644.1 Amidohydrolase 3 [Parvibaculum lavamentivorans DS-1]
MDLIIKGGEIVDGTGAPKFRGDVGVKDGKIVAVGKVEGTAKCTVDAEGAVVTPGFVDIHTHYDGQVSWDAMLAPSSINGVTSTAMGNCGVGFAPARADKHDFLIRLLEGVEDIPGTALHEGLTWDWESFPDYLDAISRRAYAIDIGAHVPHAPLRTYVMGDRGGDHTATPTADEIERMRQLTYEALQAGALGFSTTRTMFHRTKDGQNVGTLTASEDELLGITRALDQAGRGVIQLISDAYLTNDDEFAARELSLIRSLAAQTGRKLSFTVQQNDDAPDRWRQIFQEIVGMRAAGLDVSAQVAPRPIGAILSFSTSMTPYIACPTYIKLSATLRGESLVAELNKPEVKAQILSEHARVVNLTGNAGAITKGYMRMFRMNDPVDYEPSAESSLQAEADRLGRNVDDYVYDTFLEDDGQRLIYLPFNNYSYGNLDDVYGMMTGPHALYGISDGGAHCGFICDASFPTTTIGLWSKGSKSGYQIPLEALVHGYTQRNARHVGWHDRGAIKVGQLADLNVIDLGKLSLSPPEIVRDLPAGGTRLLQTAKGYRQTIKSGVVTFEDGKWTGETPGKLVRGEQFA